MDGADWGGVWHAHVLAPALATLGIPAAEWPVSVFTPLVLDRSGGKLSKTFYVRYGAAYADLPEAFLNLDVLLDQHGDDALDAIWTEVTRWAAKPRRLHHPQSRTRRVAGSHARHRHPARPHRRHRWLGADRGGCPVTSLRMVRRLPGDQIGPISVPYAGRWHLHIHPRHPLPDELAAPPGRHAAHDRLLGADAAQ